MAMLNPMLTWMHRCGLRGRNRLHQLLSRSLGAWPLLTVQTKYGPKLLVNPHEYVDSYIIRYGFYESEVFEALKPFFTGGGVFWDIGSNTGIHGLSAKFLYPQLDVVCFEPVPVLADRILAGARLNHLSITLCATALSDAPGAAWMDVTPGNLGMSQVVDNRAADGPALLSATATADALVSSGRIPAPNFIKIDVEGSELRVLQGMSSILAGGSVKAIAIEAGPDFLHTTEHPYRRILDAAGFQFTRLNRAEPTEHNLDNYLGVR